MPVLVVLALMFVRWEDALDLVNRAEMDGVKPDMIRYILLCRVILDAVSRYS